MHSRILGIMSNKDVESAKQYEEELKLPLWSFEENVPYFADYVGETDDFEADFDWVVECLQVVSKKFIANKETHSIKFLKGFKEEYFKDRYDKIKEFFNNPASLKTFCGIASETKNKYLVGDELYKMQSLIEKKYSFYVADLDSAYQTLDSFIRNADEDEEYVVFDSIDYHY